MTPIITLNDGVSLMADYTATIDKMRVQYRTSMRIVSLEELREVTKTFGSR